MPSQRTELTVLLTGSLFAVSLVVTKKELLRAYVSLLCQKLSSRPVIESDLMRDSFVATSLEGGKTVLEHTHGDAAALRSGATQFACALARHSGCSLFILGMSRSDQRKNLKGSRQWFWAKDVNADNRLDVERPDDIRYICDVDYYMDMPKLLSSAAKPVVLYTVSPESAVSSGQDDTSFHFLDDGSLETIVAGGGRYNHFLWDYGVDSLLAVKYRFGIIPIRAISYAVERKQVGKHRQCVLITPIRIFGWVSAWIAALLLDSKPLKRFRPVVTTTSGERFIRFNVMEPGGTLKVSTARPGSWLAADVEASVDESIATVARLGTTNLMLPTTASWCASNRAAAAVLTEYHRHASKRTSLTIFPVKLGVRTYQYKPEVYNQEAKAKLQAFMPPLVHGAFAPAMNKASEERCVEGRIKKYQSRSPPPPTPFVLQCIDEFAELVVGNAVLEPFCFETIAAKQTTPAQRISLARASVAGTIRKKILKCFLKAEAYGDVKDPRNISTYNDSDKLDMSMFTLALSDFLKQFKWYGPGMTPREISERIVEMLLPASMANISDYERMDGTITELLRLVERAILMKAFKNHRSLLNELLKNNVGNIGYLPEGTTFDQGFTHGSGCPGTSVFQTLRAVFTAYLAFRHTRKADGCYYSPDEAFSAIGIHLGDDGVDADLPVESHLWAAEKVGLRLEAAVVPRGERGVNFLARYYTEEVWEGNPNSMCDVKRQLAKFHTTVRLPKSVTAEQKLVEKAMSFLATDANTPVIGQFCRRVLLLSEFRPKRLLGVGSWWSRFDESSQYPNRNDGGWMDVEFQALFKEFDRSQFDQWMDSANTIEKLLQPPLCAEPRAATPTVVDVVVDETIVLARPTTPTTSEETQSSASTNERVRPKRSRNNPAKRGKPVKSPRSVSRGESKTPSEPRSKTRVRVKNPKP